MRRNRVTKVRGYRFQLFAHYMLVTISKWPDATVAGTTGAHMRAVTHEVVRCLLVVPDQDRTALGEPCQRPFHNPPARRIPLVARGVQLPPRRCVGCAPIAVSGGSPTA